MKLLVPREHADSIDSPASPARPTRCRLSCMGEPAAENDSSPSAQGKFATTHWSVIRAAAECTSDGAIEALAKLCQSYWYPLYFYVRRLGHQPDDAQDLTQEFFWRVLEKRYLCAADPEKGRFRSFLLTALKRFMANQWDKVTRQKRGGDQVFLSLQERDVEGRYLAEPADYGTPEKAYDRRWALALLEKVVHKLEREFISTGRGHLFLALKPWITAYDDPAAYPQAAAQLKMTQGALRVAVCRLRQRYRETLRAEIGNTVSQPDDIDEEIRYLFAALSN